jgi:hypothetical protein
MMNDTARKPYGPPTARPSSCLAAIVAALGVILVLGVAAWWLLRWMGGRM